MARARARRRPSDAPDTDGAVLSSSAIVDSDPASRRNLIVEGSIDAEVPLHAHGVAVGATGRVRGDIYAAVIRVEGEVVGDLYGDVQVRVGYLATVRGNIIAPNVIVEEGARFKGHILMEKPPPFMAPDPDEERPASLTA